jgi:hypothetical protein
LVQGANFEFLQLIAIVLWRNGDPLKINSELIDFLQKKIGRDLVRLFARICDDEGHSMHGAKRSTLDSMVVHLFSGKLWFPFFVPAYLPFCPAACLPSCLAA